MNIVTFILLTYVIIVGLVCLLGLFLDKGWI